MNFSLTSTPRAEGVILTTTNQTTLFPAQAENMTEIAEWINVCNVTGSDATITVEWTDSSASETYSLVKEMTVPANGSVRFTIGFVLAKDDAIKVTAGTANALHVVLKVIEMGRNPQGSAAFIGSS